VKLRDYQDYSIDAVLNYFINGGTGNPLVAAPTGVGKSVMIAGLIARLFNDYKGLRIMVLTHVKELIDQNHAKLLELWPAAPAGIYSAGLKRKDRHTPITFGGIGSVANCPLYFGKVDFLLVDEAHLISLKESSQYQTFISDLKITNPYLVVVGYTATKFRMGQGLLTEGEGALFSNICYDATTMEAFNWFFDQGYLCRLRPRPTKTEIDAAGVRTVAGEYHQGDMAKAVDKKELTEKIVAEAIEMGEGKHSWICFAQGVKHTINVANELNRQGIPTTYVHSNSKEYPMSDAERDQRIADYKAGKYQCMVNNGILTTGFDHPALDYIIVFRKTKSVGLWVQMLGRGTRPFYAFGYDLSTQEGRLAAIANSEKPYCLVADFAGNAVQLGPINDPCIPRPKEKGVKLGEVPIKICDKCGTYNHASVTTCDHCGAEFPRMIKLLDKASNAELIRSSKVEEPKPIEVKMFNVSRVEYAPHFKPGRPPSIRVTYYCGLRRFFEWVCLEHTGSVQTKSKNWWRDRSKVPPPESTTDALNYVDTLRVPNVIHVRLDTENPQILNYEYTV